VPSSASAASAAGTQYVAMKNGLEATAIATSSA
jgi:hypothetical protein